MSNFISGKQNAEASEGSFVIQSQRDTSIYVGLSYSEVKEIFSDLHEKNFPILREEARQASIKEVNEFSKIFFERIGKIEKLQLVTERLANPDVQAAVTSSVMHVGRMTDKSHKELLAELLARKISHDEETENYLLNEAIEIASSIDANQIKFTAFSLALARLGPALNTNIYIPDETRKIEFFHYYADTIPKYIDGLSKPLDIPYLSYKGITASAGGLFKYAIPLLDIISKNTGVSFNKFSSDEELTDFDFFTKLFPKLSRLLKGYGFKSVEDFNLAPLSRIGSIIGESYLRNKGFFTDQ